MPETPAERGVRVLAGPENVCKCGHKKTFHAWLRGNCEEIVVFEDCSECNCRRYEEQGAPPQPAGAVEESGLPEIGGDRMDRSIAEFENACKVHLREEQAKPSPDNSLIALLCDAVRLGREHARLATSPLVDESGHAPCEREQRLQSIQEHGACDGDAQWLLSELRAAEQTVAALKEHWCTRTDVETVVSDLHRALSERDFARESNIDLIAQHAQREHELRSEAHFATRQRDEAQAECERLQAALNNIPAQLMLTVGPPYMLQFSEAAIKQIAEAIAPTQGGEERA